MTPAVLLVVFLAPLSAAEIPCVEIEGNDVRIRDLLPAAPGLSSLPPDRVVAPLPAPGARRWIKLSVLDPRQQDEVCAIRLLRPVAREDVLDAIGAARAARGWVKLSIELVSFPQGPFPRGVVKLDRGVLRPDRQANDPAVVIWHGHLEYDRLRTLPFQIRVRLRSARDDIIATRGLSAGHLIGETDIRRERREILGLETLAPVRDFSALGMETARAIRAGQTLSAADLVQPREVKRGDRVNVIVRSNRAVLRLEARALAAGRRGDWVVLENPATKKRFRGRIDGPGSVLIDPHGGAYAN
jgi:flagella basal body P-ring formation protein FlgA